MQSRRRSLVLGATAWAAAPFVARHAWAAEAGADLPVPAVLSLGASGAEPLEAVAGTQAFVYGARAAVMGFGQP